jgi:hypothetical protein
MPEQSRGLEVGGIEHSISREGDHRAAELRRRTEPHGMFLEALSKCETWMATQRAES